MVDSVSQRLQSSCRVELERVLQGDFKIKVNVGQRRTQTRAVREHSCATPWRSRNGLLGIQSVNYNARWLKRGGRPTPPVC